MNLDTQIYIAKTCWEKILHVSLMVLHILQAEALAAFVLDYIFKDICIANNLEKWIYLSWEKRVDLFANQYNKYNVSRVKIGQFCL